MGEEAPPLQVRRVLGLRLMNFAAKSWLQSLPTPRTRLVTNFVGVILSLQSLGARQALFRRGCARQLMSSSHNAQLEHLSLLHV